MASMASVASMFSSSEFSKTATTLLAAYASLAGSMMLIRSMVNEAIPHQLRSYVFSKLHHFFTPLSPNLTLAIDEVCGMSKNHVYEAAEIYLRTMISPKTERLNVSKTRKQKNFTIDMEKGEVIVDRFEDVVLTWKYLSVESQKGRYGEKRLFELSFQKKYKQKVLDFYLPYVLLRAEEIKRQNKAIKLYSRHCPYYSGDDDDEGYNYRSSWGCITLEHPATFDTLAMDPGLKEMIIDDLERFLKRKDYYKKVGKAWKRGYLLYGPPGTGKSSLVAAMANYLKFDIYDLGLTSIYSDNELRRILLSTSNRSILLIEDIDCSSEVLDRRKANKNKDQSDKAGLTLSGILNCIDGLWSSCGDERIIVFTTNYKDRLDPALLRPGRMDLHIHMSYCSSNGFRTLAANYLDINDSKSSPLFKEIDGLLENVEATPAEIAEELLRSDDANVALQGLVNMLKRKRAKKNEANEIKSKATGKKKEDNENKSKATGKKNEANGDQKKIRPNNRKKKK